MTAKNTLGSPRSRTHKGQPAPGEAPKGKGKKSKGAVVPPTVADAPEATTAAVPEAEKGVATGNALAIDSTASALTPSDSTAAPAAAEAKDKRMTLNLKGLDKRGRNAIYTGAAISLRFPIGAFPSKTAPATLVIDGLAEKVERVPRAKMTKEERAALPKLTLAERVARAEQRTADLKARLAKAAEQPAAGQPAL